MIMKKPLVYFFIIIIVGIIIVGGIYFYLLIKEREAIKECMFRANEDRRKCFPGSKPFLICKIDGNEIIRIENLNDTNFKCGETIMYTVNLNLASRLPESFYPCALYDKLLNVTEWRCIEQVPFSDTVKTSYVNGGKKVLTCGHVFIGNSTSLMFFYKGTIPNVSEINLLEFYVFPSTLQKVSQDYFFDNLNLADKIYELRVNVTC